MRLARRLTMAFLTVILLCEAWFTWVLWVHGGPMLVRDERVTKSGEYSFKVAQAPIGASDWAELAVVISLQVALVGFLWWSKRKIAGSEAPPVPHC
jgi:uncharacterized membrane protein (UPF0182 family)